MKFTTKKRLMFTNDINEYIVNQSLLPETSSWGKRYNNGLDLMRCEIEDCDDIDIEAEDYVPMSEDEIRNRIYNWLDMDWEDLKYNLRTCKCDGECVIFGGVQRWNGTYRGFDFANSIEDAVRFCISGVDYVNIYQVNGHIEIEGIHHDGCNYYEIHLLNDRGLRFKERVENEYANPIGDITDRHYHKTMPDYVEDCA